ncbi:MAG: hypothetical protein AAFN59_00180 [Pseudomonadota bacterium]
MPESEKPSDEPVENKVESEGTDQEVSTEETPDTEESVDDAKPSDPSEDPIDDPEVARAADEGMVASELEAEGTLPVDPENDLAENPETPAQADPEPASTPQPAQPKRNGTVPFLVGGFAAIVIGFLFAQALPEGWPRPPDQTLAQTVSTLSETIDAQATTISDLTARLETLGGDVNALEAREFPAFAAPDDLAALDARLKTAQDALSERITQVEAAVDALEAIPAAPDSTGMTQEDVAQFRDELAAVVAGARSELDEARRAAEAVEAAAVAAAAREAAFEALTRLRTSVDLGLGYEEALADLTDAAPVTPTPAVANSAADGIATMLELQSEFPDLARTAISASATAPDESATAVQRLGQFLRTQTNARSLEPREGTDADAVLSRAQAALMDNELDAALAELSTLPDAAAGTFEDWIAKAEMRSDALAGLDDLAAQIGAM